MKELPTLAHSKVPKLSQLLVKAKLIQHNQNPTQTQASDFEFCEIQHKRHKIHDPTNRYYPLVIKKLVEWGGVRKFLLPYVNAVWGSTA